ncbi:hypothetical protein [Streptomyces sp. NBC_00859]|uniref:hypothetical protein n=1 Tax=Streptomyces sp. NBC_00859 TaxID=2903682 RepID=UPI00386C85A9|nr:hypothetical protein OG584_12035 [Streptomyces sp. NBC_00859]
MPLVATVCVLPLYAVWVAVLATGGGDLAAQFAWAGFASRHPASAYNLFWYGGTHTANYSLLTPYLMACFGARTVSVLAGIGGTWVLSLVVVRSGVRWPAAPAVLGALALWCNVASGRTTFAVGVAVGLLAVLWVERRVAAPVCAALATMASPVAGLFLVVLAGAHLLDRQWRKGLGLALPPFLVVAATTLAFPFQGEQPMATGKLWMPLAACAALGVAARHPIVRYSALVYGVGVVLTYLVPSPIGTNVERLVGLVGPVVLLAAVIAERAAGRRVVLAAALCLNCYWLADKTVDDLRVSTTVPAWASDTKGVVTALRGLRADRTRVEVVPARNHREATLLAPHVNMARGWNRQLDVERGRLFYDGSLNAARYRAWLDRFAVGYVVLHDGRPDGPAEGEAALVRSRPPWLRPVWHDAHWRVYRVHAATPLVGAPASVVRGGDAQLVVHVPRPGTVTVRIAYSPWLRASGNASLHRRGEWTGLTVKRAGDYRLGSGYRALVD